MLPPVFPIYYFRSKTVQNSSVGRGIHKEHGCKFVADFAKPCAAFQRATQNDTDAKPHRHALWGNRLFVGGMQV